MTISVDKIGLRKARRSPGAGASLAVAMAGACLWMAAVSDVRADAVEDFYKGKQLTFIVSTEPGTPYDGYARTLATYLPEHLPGKPGTVVQNMPGASGLKAANFMASVAPRDGTHIAATHSVIPTAPLLSPGAAQFDSRTLGWIGSLTKEIYTGYVRSDAPIKSFEEGKTIQAIIGGQSVGSAGTDLVILSNELFGTKFKIITGYKSSTDVKLAMEKGEVHGTFGNSYTSLTTEQPDWLRDKFVRIIIQHGLAKHRELPDVPQFIEQAKTPADRQLLELVLARQETGKPYFTTPDVPKERLQALRDAFDATLKDPKFHAALAKIRLPTDSPMGGAEVAELAGRLAGTSPDVVQRMEGILNKFREGR